MKPGLKPTYRDRRDHSFHRTFGSLGNAVFPDFTFDVGLTMPDQIADQNYFECTGYAITDIATDEDRIIYSPSYLYAKTLLLEGVPPTAQGAELRDALKASRTSGLLPLADVPPDLLDAAENINADYRRWPTALDLIAGTHRRGAYFNVQPLNGSWRDGLLSAMQVGKRSILVGTPWPPEFETTGSDGIVKPFLPAKTYTWHAWKACGQQTINGERYLICKSWQGKEFGDNGYCYFSEDILNQLWRIAGTQAFTFGIATAADIQPIEVDILAELITLYNRLLNLWHSSSGSIRSFSPS